MCDIESLVLPSSSLVNKSQCVMFTRRWPKNSQLCTSLVSFECKSVANPSATIDGRKKERAAICQGAIKSQSSSHDSQRVNQFAASDWTSLVSRQYLQHLWRLQLNFSAIRYCNGNNHPLKITASLENAAPLGALSQYSVASNPMSRLVQTVMPESIEPSAVVERAMPQAVNKTWCVI